MANQTPTENPILTIEGLRAQDEKNEKNEVTPEKQTLNSARVLNFLTTNGITVGNLDKDFTVDAAINLTSKSSSETEKGIAKKFAEAKSILGKYDALSVFGERTREVVESKLENLKTPPTKMSGVEAGTVLKAWELFDLIREHARRLLGLGATMKESRKESMTGESKGFDETIRDGLHGARENWDKLSGKQKVAFAGMALLSGIFLMKSDNGVIKKIRETLFTGLKVVGGAWVLNKVWYLFTGETAFDALTGGGKSSKSTFFKETFNTDDRGAEVLNKGVVSMGDLGFMDLATRYAAAKAEGKKVIEGTNMPPEEAYMAMDVFFGKYPAEKLMKEYANYTPPASLAQVVTIEMSKDPTVKMQDGLADRMWDGTKDYLKRAYNYLGSTAPAVWVAEKYEKWHGKKGSPEELKKFVEKFKAIAKSEADLPKAIESSLADGNKQITKEYIDTTLAGITETKFGLKYKKAADGYLYMVVDKPVEGLATDEAAVSTALKANIETTEKFLTETFHVSADQASKKVEPHGSIFVGDKGTLKYFARYKL